MPSPNAVSVIGAGDMGHGFAAHFARHGKDVTLIDHRQSNLDEAAAEILDVKREMFSTVADAAPGGAVLASNTSSIPITDIAAAVPGDADPDRFRP